MAELKKIVQQFKGQMTDFNNESLPKDFFLDSLNIRFNTNKDRVQGGFVFERGTSMLFRLGKIYFQGYPLNTLEYVDNKNPNKVKSLPYIEFDEKGNYTELGWMYVQLNNGPSKGWSGEQEIIEIVNTEDGLILFSTDGIGVDCIWYYNVIKNDLELKYVRNMGFNKKHPIKAIYNYENELVRKVYWIDGKSQIKFINIDNSKSNGDYEELIDVKLENINQVGFFKISQPEVDTMSNGGQHTAGTIQYAYNLYKMNGNQTKLSPLSRMVSLGNGTVSGGNINDKVTDLPFIKIKDLDKNYTNIRVYAIKYTAFNTVPDIYIVSDNKIDDHKEFVLYDTGTIRVQDISLEQLLFIGSDPIFPKEIESKDNHLFVTNYTESKYQLKTLDVRAFGFTHRGNLSRQCNKFKTIYDSDGESNGVEMANDAKIIALRSDEVINSTFKLPDETYLPLNIKEQIFCADGETPGLEGKYLKLIMDRKGFGFDEDGKPYANSAINAQNLLKDRELYRFSVKFYNGYGQYTDPFFIGDFYTENTGKELFGFRMLGNPDGAIIEPKIQFKKAFADYLSDENNFLNVNGIYDERLKPVGFKLLRAVRRPEDRLNIVQGLINPMLSMHPSKSVYKKSQEYIDQVYKEGYKMPWFMRTTSSLAAPVLEYRDKAHIAHEVFTSVDSDLKRTSHLQFNKMMQLYSPELLFSELNSVNTRRYRVIGMALNKEVGVYGAETNVKSLEKVVFTKVLNRLSPHASEAPVKGLDPMVITTTAGKAEDLLDYGWVGPSGGETTHEIQFYRNFSVFHDLVSSSKELGKRFYEGKTLGKPIIVERGQGETAYNGYPLYTFTNKFDRFRTDTPKDKKGTSDPRGSLAITRLNAYNERNITFVDSNEDPIETIFKKSQLTTNPSAYSDMLYSPMVEFFRDISYYYNGNMYNGNTGQRRSTVYMEVGNYNPLYKNNKLNTSPIDLGMIGDIMYGEFKFQRISSGDTIISPDSYQAMEIVSFLCESEVDLTKRSDLSIHSWDSYFMPKYESYKKYNRVYSQQDNIFKNISDSYNFKVNLSYTNRILATRKKMPGELIDSWTDMMVNNIIDVDGKYGPIVSITSMGQQLVVLQKNAVAVVNVNPRVQILDKEGNDIELGSGEVLHDYKYISTEYGSSHRFSTVITKNGLYFYDDNNKTICLCNGEGVIDLCKAKGISNEFKRIVQNLIIDDTANFSLGVSAGMDRAMNDVYFVFHNRVCVVFNEVLEQFAGRLSYDTPQFAAFGDKAFSINKDKMGELHQHQVGLISNFYGANKPNYLKFLVNPEPLTDILLSNISFRIDESTINDPINWSSIRVSNEYQDTEYIDLKSRVNFRFFDRFVNVTIGRDKESKKHMRDSWHNVELFYHNKDRKLYQNYTNNSFSITYKPTYTRNS